MRASVAVFALCMLFTGTINTIATKYQDITVVGRLPDGTPITFKHPAVQSACMFFGESLCLIPYFYLRWRKQRAKRLDPSYIPMHPAAKRSRRISRILAFAVPTLCDATGTTLMNIGLFYTYASTYQMLRGTLVLFAGMFTILILRRQLYIHNWLGMVLIAAGAALVGASSVIYQAPPASANVAFVPAAAAGGAMTHITDCSNTSSNLHYSASISRVASRGMMGISSAHMPDAVSSSSSSARFGNSPSGNLFGGAEPGADVATAPLFGDLLVVAAQMFTALQFILEEKFLVKYKVPALLAVGLEGCWGLLLCALVLPIATLVKGRDGLPVDDAVSAFQAILADSHLAAAVNLSILSIAFFNFFGVSVTKSLSGAARATIDACRTLFIWLYCLRVGWEQFHMLEVVGFLVLISGTSLYNEILKSCLPGNTADSDETTIHPRPRRRPYVSAPQLLEPGDAALNAPLLANAAADGTEAGCDCTAAAAGAAETRKPSVSWRAPPVPLTRPAPAHQQCNADAGQSQSAGSWVYTMARSVRLGMHTLSPQSLTATGGLSAPDMDSESGSEPSDGYLSSTPGGVLADSLHGGGVSNGTSSSGGGRGVLQYATGGVGVSNIGLGVRGGSSGGGNVSSSNGRTQPGQVVVGFGIRSDGVLAAANSTSSSGGGRATCQAATPFAGLPVTGEAAAAAAAEGSSRRSSVAGTPPLPRSASAGSLPRSASGGGSTRGSRASRQ
eukprot:GHRR01000766.1.p1 GENE.GHRR01000766.1~~GHRR01000766.1.p1  ORF type:complete len:730 (+),score=256.50 GHRR01000766.1:2549-4738(+)